MEFHIGVSVTILAPDNDAANGSPAREIAIVLLVGIFCVVLVGRDELVVKVQVHMASRLYELKEAYHAQKQGVQLLVG